MALVSLSIPKIANEMFGLWLCSFKKYERNLITIGCSAVLWSLWKIRNECCFNNISPLMLLTLCSYAVHGWMLGQFFRKKCQKRCCWKEVRF
jgi:hypothetical protein